MFLIRLALCAALFTANAHADESEASLTTQAETLSDQCRSALKARWAYRNNINPAHEDLETATRDYLATFEAHTAKAARPKALANLRAAMQEVEVARSYEAGMWERLNATEDAVQLFRYNHPEVTFQAIYDIVGITIDDQEGLYPGCTNPNFPGR